MVNNTDSISKSDSWSYGALLPSRVASDDDAMSCIAVCVGKGLSKFHLDSEVESLNKDRMQLVC